MSNRLIISSASCDQWLLSLWRVIWLILDQGRKSWDHSDISPEGKAGQGPCMFANTLLLHPKGKGPSGPIESAGMDSKGKLSPLP